MTGLLYIYIIQAYCTYITLFTAYFYYLSILHIDAFLSDVVRSAGGFDFRLPKVGSSRLSTSPSVLFFFLHFNSGREVITSFVVLRTFRVLAWLLLRFHSPAAQWTPPSSRSMASLPASDWCDPTDRCLDRPRSILSLEYSDMGSMALMTTRSDP